MKKLRFVLFAATMLTSVAYAGQVSVTWQAPEKYTDIKAAVGTDSVFQDVVTGELGIVFADLAKKLPDDVQWNVTVTDVDLAGEVLHAKGVTGKDVRVIKDVYLPRMSVSYSMFDGKGIKIAEGSDEIKDMTFLMKGPHIASGHTVLKYEEKMLQDWFKNQQRDNKFPTK